MQKIDVLRKENVRPNTLQRENTPPEWHFHTPNKKSRLDIGAE